MKAHTRILIGLLLIFSTACSLGGFAADGSSTGSSDNPASTMGNLQAQAASPASILLSWDPIAGADGYSLEVQFGDSDFVPAADIPAEATSYEHFVLPGTTDISYRLEAATASGSRDVGTASLTLPPLEPNPTTVETELAQPTVGIPGFDPNTGLPPGFDPNNPGSFDPSTMMPPGFDPDNPDSFDMGSLMQDPSVAQEIGPDGGSVSVTAPDGAVYTLDVPAGATDQPVTFTLTPVKSIGGLPLSGGLLGAVQVKPEGFEFNLPARLTMEPAARDTNPAAPLTVGFAVSPFGQEFFLYPLASAQTGATGATPHLARLVPSPKAQTSSSSMSIDSGATYGVGSGSLQDVQNQARRVPSNSADQASQHNAQQQYVNPERAAASFLETAWNIQISIANADRASRMSSVTSQLEKYWQDGGSKFNPETNQALIDRYVTRIKGVFDRSKGDCLTSDDAVASDLAQKMHDGANDFWKAVQQAYQSKYGEEGKKLIDDLASGKRSCRYTLEFTSTIRLENGKDWAEAKVHTAAPIEMLHTRGLMATAPTRYRLAGFGDIKYDSYEFKSKGCPVAKVTQYPEVAINVVGLYPEFQVDGHLFDFLWAGTELGANWTRDIGARANQDKNGCDMTIALMGGGDLWSGGFALLHSDSGMINWSPSSGGYPLVFTKKIEDQTVLVPSGGKLIENATYTITIDRATTP
jgi:hypothetical protein